MKIFFPLNFTIFKNFIKTSFNFVEVKTPSIHLQEMLVSTPRGGQQQHSMSSGIHHSSPTNHLHQTNNNSIQGYTLQPAPTGTAPHALQLTPSPSHYTIPLQNGSKKRRISESPTGSLERQNMIHIKEEPGMYIQTTK